MLDITRPIRPSMAIYPGNPEVVFEQVKKASAESSTLTKITLGSHTGTHIDAPAHIVKGEKGSAMYDLDQLCGPCEVIDLISISTVITANDIPATTQERVLFKTKNSNGDSDVFDPQFVALDESAAKLLITRQVKLVGIDAPSIKKKGVRDAVHQLLLDAGVVIMEGLWLAEAQAGEYELLCLPLKVDLDGSPVRAALR